MHFFINNSVKDDIPQYNIRPNQVFELENIKEFLKANGFEKLK